METNIYLTDKKIYNNKCNYILIIVIHLMFDTYFKTMLDFFLGQFNNFSHSQKEGEGQGILKLSSYPRWEPRGHSFSEYSAPRVLHHVKHQHKFMFLI
jgi:hypothetical protein